FLQVVARFPEHLQPAVIPVADAGKPGGTAAAGGRPGAPAGGAHPSVPVETFALPDLLDGDLIGVGKQLGRPERNVLAAERDAAERIDIQPFERPDAGLVL